jgi:hypothetical protein
MNGTCLCPSNEWVGANCEHKPCKDECSFNGICRVGGICDCKVGFTGDTCNRKICPKALNS